VTATKFGEYRGKKRRQSPVTVANLRLFLRSSTGPNRRFQPQSLGRVRDPVRIAEGPTAIDAATQRRHFGFRLRLVDKLQPIGGARQRPRRADGKGRVFALHTAQTRPMREKGSSLNAASLTTKPLASGVYVHVPETHSPIKRSISVASLFPSSDRNWLQCGQGCFYRTDKCLYDAELNVTIYESTGGTAKLLLCMLTAGG